MTKSGAAKAHRSLPVVTGTQNIVDDGIEGAKSHDLVFAVTGYVGSGASWVATALSEKLDSAGYSARIIKMSAVIANACEPLEVPLAFDPNVPLTRAEALQNGGDELRKRCGGSFVAGLGIRQVYRQRGQAREPGDTQPLAFILDSLKHPDEVVALRSVYGSSFYLLSVVCRPHVRTQRLRLKYKRATGEDLDAFLRRDEAADVPYGQQVGKTLHLGDFFVTNDADDAVGPVGKLPQADLGDALERFLNIVLRRDVVRPTRHERGMYAAWAASLRSACLSRQVGAAILDERGELISTGTNDVPRFGGGLYDDHDDDSDHRCFKWTGRSDAPQCHNDKTKREIYGAIYEELRKMGLLTDTASAADVQAAIERSRVKDLIEFSRAVHAEMDALVSIARRGGGVTTRGASLYCTTYPCHSCARHIVASGIQDVFYIEPYRKSMAIDLHSDSIEEPTGVSSAGGGVNKVTFQLFSGVAPRRFGRLFEKRGDLKDREGVYLVTGVTTTHHDPVLTKTFADFEKDIAAQIDKIEGAGPAGAAAGTEAGADE